MTQKAAKSKKVSRSLCVMPVSQKEKKKVQAVQSTSFRTSSPACAVKDASVNGFMPASMKTWYLLYNLLNFHIGCNIKTMQRKHLRQSRHPSQGIYFFNLNIITGEILSIAYIFILRVPRTQQMKNDIVEVATRC